ncbi:GLPGLI family protein [Dokdonia sp. Asnod1-B02]|uniref:GLPGLI family protein n=1 Tax=Dokdonia sp. Asnod1-B02 TaxID=3160573 RepID=UPI003862FBF4
MKLIFSLLFGLSFFVIHSQQSIVTYSKRLLIDDSGKQNIKKVAAINSSFEKLSFTLRYNKEESIFKMDDFLDDGLSKNLNTALRIGGGNGVYASDKKNKSLHYIEYFGENYVVDYTTEYKNLNWILDNNSKTINNYLCYRATTTRTIENPTGLFEQKIIAWFSPELNSSFGPIGYGGFPGLILSLQIDNIEYTATNIQLNIIDNDIIEFPKKGKYITYNTYLDISKKLYEKMINRKN